MKKINKLIETLLTLLIHLVADLGFTDKVVGGGGSMGPLGRQTKIRQFR